jgi:hypothetical protein
VRLRLTIVALGATVALTACSGGNGKSSEAGSETSASRPLTYADVVKRGENTPAGAVLLLWFWAQWGSAPNVVAMYDPRVVRAVGARNISGIYTWLRGTLVELRPRIVGNIRTRKNLAFIAVEARSATTGPVRYSFLLRPTDGDWVVMYDTLLHDSLPQYVAFKVDGQVSANPSRRAREQGELLANRYRDLFPNINSLAPQTTGPNR